MLLGAGGAAVLLVIAIVTSALTRGEVDGETDSAPTVSRIADLATEPVENWTVDQMGDLDPEFFAPGLPVAVGDDQALVWAVFDSYAWESAQSGSGAWYDDFDAHYDIGVVAGTAYLRAEEAALAGRAEWPEPEDFWPAGFPGDWRTDDPDYAGFEAGFDDAIWEVTGEPGRVPAPRTIDADLTVVLVDLTDGSARWTLDLASIAPDADYSWFVDAVSLDGGSMIVVRLHEVFAQEADYRVNITTIATLDARDGSVISTVTTRENTSIHGVGDALLFFSTGTGGAGPDALLRVDPAALDADPMWRQRIRGMDSPSVEAFAAGQVGVVDFASMAVVSLADGAVVWTGENAVRAGGALVSSSLNYQSALYALEAVSPAAKTLWEGRAAATVWSLDGYLFVAGTRTGDFSSPESYSAVQRVDPVTGDDLWEAPVDKVRSILGVSGNEVVMIVQDRVVTVDLRTGKEATSSTTTGIPWERSAWLGTDSVYVVTESGLLAYSLGDGVEQWSYPIPDDAYVTRIGHHLLLTRPESGTLTGLGVG